MGCMDSHQRNPWQQSYAVIRQGQPVACFEMDLLNTRIGNMTLLM